MVSIDLRRAVGRVLLVAGMFFPLVLVGCEGAGLLSVKGKVVYEDGTPVAGGTITFNNDALKTSASGTIANDGTFNLSGKEGAPAGSYKVVVVGKSDEYGAPPTVADVYGDPSVTPLKQDLASGSSENLTITVKRPDKKKR